MQKVFAYGFRNSFGMDFDPVTGELWTQENGDDTFTEINRVMPGHNGGWIQVMGPLHRIDQYKEIETTQFGGALQQLAAALAADADRRQPRRGTAAPVHAARRAIQRPRVQLEVRAASGGHRVHARRRARQRVRGRSLPGRRPHGPPVGTDVRTGPNGHLYVVSLTSGAVYEIFRR